MWQHWGGQCGVSLEGFYVVRPLSLDFDLVSCCVDRQHPQVGRCVFISAYNNFILVYDFAMCFCE